MLFSKPALTLPEYLQHLQVAIDKIHKHGKKTLAEMPESEARAEHFEALEMLVQISSSIKGLENTISPEPGTRITEDTVHSLRAVKPLLFTKIVLDGKRIEAHGLDDREAVKMLRKQQRL